MNNECAIEFYQKFGFEIVETREQYYKRIEPAGAHVLEKNLRKSGSNSTTTTIPAAVSTTGNDTANHLSNGNADSTNSTSNSNQSQTKSAKLSA